jgi:exportin-2 (importin alpha re-exporter)
MLAEGAKQPGFMIQLLQLVDNGNTNPAVRQAAAVYFKNTVKAGWDASKDAEERKSIEILDQDRATIKQHLVELMCTVPPVIQAQLSEAICIIATQDYPHHWESLLPNLVQKLQSDNATVVNGVLMTADSIFKSFRDVQRSDELYSVIIYTLKGIQEPLLALFVKTTQEVYALANDEVPLVEKMESLRLIVSIYYSLVYQDLPEFFEDNMNPWMEGFARYLEYSNPVLVDDDEEDKPDPIAKLQTAIVDVLKLYVERDEEVWIKDNLSQFTSLVWKLLLGTSKAAKYDQLVVISMKYLSILVGRQIYGQLFQDDSVLQQIVSNIVIPNMMYRESDVDNFEDNPEEFILTELEGADNESRRRCGRDLLKAMCRQFETQTTAICTEHIKRLVAEFTANPADKWISKDTAVR